MVQKFKLYCNGLELILYRNRIEICILEISHLLIQLSWQWKISPHANFLSMILPKTTTILWSSVLMKTNVALLYVNTWPLNFGVMQLQQKVRTVFVSIFSQKIKNFHYSFGKRLLFKTKQNEASLGLITTSAISSRLEISCRNIVTDCTKWIC